MTEQFDYKKMLRAYIRMIVDIEGVDYLVFAKDWKGLGLSDAEINEMRKIGNEFLPEGFKHEVTP